MEMGDLNKVWEIKVMKKKPREDEAKKILERIAIQVQPILRRRKWRVKLISEFCQKNLLGLNVNRGANVRLRLREWNREWEFFPFEKILDTMLHEIAHMERGPHDAIFYKLWDELRMECMELMAQGITGSGQGFDLPGRRLGGSSRSPPLSSLNQTMLASAENRKRLHALLPAGCKRLGGDKELMSVLTPVQAAAMAAERRLQDDIWCQSWSNAVFAEEESDSDLLTNVLSSEERPLCPNEHNNYKSQSTREGSRKRSRLSKDGLFGGSSESSCTGFVDLTTEDDSSSSSCSHSTNDHPRLKPAAVTADSSASSIDHGHGTDWGAHKLTMWECENCTLLNRRVALVCEACNSVKPKDASMKYKYWPCKFCTLENNVTLDKCSACGQWRYSHGPPVSTNTRILGT